MGKIGTLSDRSEIESVLRTDIRTIREAINLMQSVDSGWTEFSNLTTTRTLDADATTVAELADVLGTLIEKLKTAGIITA